MSHSIYQQAGENPRKYFPTFGQMYQPAALKMGDSIGLMCPARKISLTEIQPAIDWLESAGFKVVLGRSIGAEHHQFAGDDQLRRRDLQEMLDHPDIKAIIACRGGYGTVRLIDDLYYGNFVDKPKWLCGYSDMTALHSHVNHVMGIGSLHCTMPVNFQSNTPEALQSLLDGLTGKSLNYEFAPHVLNRNGSMQGEVVGGNLSILYSLLGTKTGLHTGGKILFLEDLDEYLYHIDRMMMALKRAGKLQGLAGIIVGGMTDMRDNPVPFGKSAEEIILEHCAPYAYPVCFGFPAGHIHDNRAIKLGQMATVEMSGSTCTFSQ
jgi:muramoyltetrapeptide carboxypeptidase